MSTSRNPLMPSKPTGNDPIPRRSLGFARALSKHALFTFLRTEFKKSGLSQKDLADRLGGKDAATISRILATPSNLETDTAADFLFAISGGVLKYDVTYPFEEQKQEISIAPEATSTTPSGESDVKTADTASPTASSPPSEQSPPDAPASS